MANPTLTNVSNLRADFPILDIKVGGCGLVYLDNAATSQKLATSSKVKLVSGNFKMPTFIAACIS
jgi:selenocysteine lyase/cysteine desulfurase